MPSPYPELDSANTTPLYFDIRFTSDSDSTPNCSSTRNENNGLESDIPVIVASAIAIIFNILILLTNFNRRRRKKLDSVLIQFTMLAVTDVLASLMMLTHYSTRISYGTKDNLEDMLNRRFDSNNNDSSILIEGNKYKTYISTGFMLMKKTNSTCGELAYRYFTMRWYTEASNRLLLIYMNISRTIILYKTHSKERTEMSAIIVLSIVAFVVPGVMMLFYVFSLYLVSANWVLIGSYLVTYILPFFILLVTSVMLICKIQIVGRAAGRHRRVQTRAERNKKQLITVVVVVTLAYLLTHLPGLIYLLFVSGVFPELPEIVKSVMARINAVALALNSLVNFPLFLCFSEQFLTEFRQLFGCGVNRTATMIQESGMGVPNSPRQRRRTNQPAAPNP